MVRVVKGDPSDDVDDVLATLEKILSICKRGGFVGGPVGAAKLSEILQVAEDADARATRQLGIGGRVPGKDGGPSGLIVGFKLDVPTDVLGAILTTVYQAQSEGMGLQMALATIEGLAESGIKKAPKPDVPTHTCDDACMASGHKDARRDFIGGVG